MVVEGPARRKRAEPVLVLLPVPREVREALVAWEYCDEFPLPIASGRKGEAKDVSGGAYTKTFDLGAGA